VVRVGNREFVGSPIKMSADAAGAAPRAGEIGEHSRESY